MRALHQKVKLALAQAEGLTKRSLALMERAHRIAHDARNSRYEAEILRAKARMEENESETAITYERRKRIGARSGR